MPSSFQFPGRRRAARGRLIGIVAGSLMLLYPRLAPAESAPLADAAEARDGARFDALLTRDADVNAAQIDGMTALLWAAYHDDEDRARRLLAHGADATHPNRYGITPLHLACLNGNPNLLDRLLAAGADPQASIPGGETALMTAARTGSPASVRLLLDAGANVDAREGKGQTAIMWAAAEGHLQVVDLLLDAKADYLTPLPSGFTPLYFAVREGHPEIVQRLLVAGADPNDAMTIEKSTGNRGPRSGTSPLLLAIENGHYDLAVTLLEVGADPNDQRTGFTPLHTLTWIRQPDIGESASGAPPPRGSGRRTSEHLVRDLVAHGADVNARLTRGRRAGKGHVSQVGATPFFLAADRADLAYMKLLLALGADPTIPNEDRCTPLLVAAGVGSHAPEEEAGSERECRDAVAWLLSLGADIDAVDDNGETAMHGAAYKNAPAVAWLLHEHGADIRIWNTRNKLKRTPLLIAEGYRPGNFKPSFETVDAIAAIMQRHGVQPPNEPKPHHTNYSP